MSKQYCEYVYGQVGNHLKRTDVFAFLEFRIFFSGKNSEGMGAEIVTL